MSFILRPHQVHDFGELRVKLRTHRSVLLVAPCGYGKGVLVGKIIEGALSKGKHILFLVRGRDRVNDQDERVTGLGIAHGVLMSARRREPWHPVQIASSDTVFRMIHKPRADIVVVDESHLALSDSFRKVLGFYPDAKIIGMTATPILGNNRALGKASGGIFESMVVGPSVPQLIKEGYLVGSRVIAPHAPDKLSEMKKKDTGEFDENEGAAICDNAKVIGDIVDHYKRFSIDRKAIVFGFHQAHAFHIAEQFRAAGLNWAYVDASTPDGDIHTPGTRKFIWHQYDYGDLQGISSCRITQLGWDHSICKTIIFASKVGSFPDYHQRLGRGSRCHPGFDHFRVHDHTGSLFDHERAPFFESEIEWQLDGDPVKLKDKDKAPRVRTCNTPVLAERYGPAPSFTGEVRNGFYLPCLRPQAIGPTHCRYCGIPFLTIPREIEHADGELKEVEVVSKSAAQLANEEKLRKRYLELARIGATSLKRNGEPFAKGYASMQFKLETHRWPAKAWKDEAEELYGELRPSSGQGEMYA